VQKAKHRKNCKTDSEGAYPDRNAHAVPAKDTTEVGGGGREDLVGGNWAIGIRTDKEKPTPEQRNQPTYCQQQNNDFSSDYNDICVGMAHYLAMPLNVRAHSGRVGDRQMTVARALVTECSTLVRSHSFALFWIARKEDQSLSRLKEISPERVAFHQ
jgi:hypothetical protein